MRKVLTGEKEQSSANDKIMSAKVTELQQKNTALQSRMRTSHEENQTNITTLQVVLQQLSEVSLML